jgi:hypothetical protein
MQTTLINLQAFKAMRRYLEDYYDQTAADDVGLLLSGTQLFEDGETWDPVFWEDWEIIIGSQENLTFLQAFITMQKFLGDYAKEVSSKDIKQLLESMELMPQGGTRNPERWEKWLRACDVELKNE